MTNTYVAFEAKKYIWSGPFPRKSLPSPELTWQSLSKILNDDAPFSLIMTHFPLWIPATSEFSCYQIILLQKTLITSIYRCS